MSKGSIFGTNFFNWLLLLVFYASQVHWINATETDPSNSVVENNFKACNADLENKFMAERVKCPRNGLFPVKGSCTAFIYCFSLDDDLIKPIKRAECSTGMAFDIGDLRCRSRSDQTLKNCLQRQCYPAETFMEDAKLLILTSSKEEPHRMNTDTDINTEDDDETVLIDIQIPSNNTVCEPTTDYANQRNVSCVAISAAVVNSHEILIFVWVPVFLLNAPF